jgi:hypothetical protein
MAEVVGLVNEFCAILRKVTLSLVNYFPERDPFADDIRRKVFVAIDLAPVQVVEEVGYYLYEYRGPIYAGDDEFFLRHTFSADYAAAVDVEKADLVFVVIGKLRHVLAEADPPTRALYRAEVVKMLDIFLDYWLATRPDG